MSCGASKFGHSQLSRNRLLSTTFPATSKHFSTQPQHSNSEFFSQDVVNFEELNVCETLCSNLKKAGIVRPSNIQSKAIPQLLSGEHNQVIIGAETGTGKTVAYLAPLVQLISDRKKSVSSKSLSIIVQPTRELCSQVIRMSKPLTSRMNVRVQKFMGHELFSEKFSILPLRPDIVITTPNCLKINLESDRDIMKQCKYIVFDEADLLLAGACQKDTFKILSTIGSPRDTTKENDQLNSKKKLRKKIKKRRLPKVKFPAPHLKYNRDPRLIFVAATIPSIGEKSVKSILESQFPSAFWALTHLLHRKTDRLEHTFIEATGRKLQFRRLLDVVKGDSLDGMRFAKGKRLLIFCGTTESARSVAHYLQQFHIPCVAVHSDLSEIGRLQSFEEFEAKKVPILVCTDLLSRGIDFDNVDHVIQFDFAKNVTDYLHRIGRTARVGKTGKVTSIYSSENDRLVSGIKDSESNLEQLFSRKRSLRTRLKRQQMPAM